MNYEKFKRYIKLTPLLSELPHIKNPQYKSRNINSRGNFCDFTDIEKTEIHDLLKVEFKAILDEFKIK